MNRQVLARQFHATAVSIAEHSLTEIRRPSNSLEFRTCRRIHANEVELIATIAIGFALAFAFGFVAIRLGLPPLVGYLIAGVCIGPSTPGFVADREIAGQLAEIGVILLMFGVGLLFSEAELMAVRRIARSGCNRSDHYGNSHRRQHDNTVGVGLWSWFCPL